MGASVLVIGATGYIGNNFALQLGKAGVPTSALVRPSSDSKPEREQKLEQLKATGVKIVEGDVSDDQKTLVQLFKKFDTVISAVSGHDLVAPQLKLIEAAKEAGTIKLFIPNYYGGDYPIHGPHAGGVVPPVNYMMQGKETVHKALKAAGIAYIDVICHAFFGWTLPVLGGICLPGQTEIAKEITVYNGGNVKGASTFEEDIGAVVAKAVNDPRTFNKKLVIKVNTLTQNEMIETWEKVSGKTVTRKEMSAEQLEGALKGAEGMGQFVLALLQTIWVAKLYDTPHDELGEGESVYATELYPDYKFKTVAEWLKGWK